MLALYLIFKITLGIVGWSCYQTLSTIHNYHYPSSLALPYYRRNSQNLPKQQKATPCFSPISKIALKFAQILSLPSPTTLKSSVWEFEGNGTEQRNCTNVTGIIADAWSVQQAMKHWEVAKMFIAKIFYERRQCVIVTINWRAGGFHYRSLLGNLSNGRSDGSDNAAK